MAAHGTNGIAAGVTAQREIERKYEAGTLGIDAGALLGAGAEPREHTLVALYFDTVDLRLLAGGITLRRRTGGDDAGWHLKLPAGADEREELRLPLGEPGAVPSELVALVRAYTRGAELVPVAELSTYRRTWVRTDAAGAALAELVDDEVTARTIGEHGTTQAWHEIEVELREHGPRALLDDLDQALRTAGVQRSGASSKLGRVLAGRLPAPAEASRAVGAGSAAAAVLDYLRTHVRQLRRHDPLVRLDRPDAVHQMRVSARRLRSALQAFRRVLDRGQTDPLTIELAWLAGELGPARDTEVIAARFVDLLTELPGELVLGPVAETLDDEFARRQAAARTRAIAALDSDRYVVLLGRLEDLLADPPLTRHATGPARREIPVSVARAYGRLDDRMAVAAEAPTPGERDLALHEARKAAKRLRYAAEVALPVAGRPARALIERLKGFQDLLGERQDTVVARPVLRELSVIASAQGHNGFTYGLLHAAEAARAAAADAALPGAWRRLRKQAAEWPG